MIPFKMIFGIICITVLHKHSVQRVESNNITSSSNGVLIDEDTLPDFPSPQFLDVVPLLNKSSCQEIMQDLLRAEFAGLPEQSPHNIILQTISMKPFCMSISNLEYDVETGVYLYVPVDGFDNINGQDVCFNPIRVSVSVTRPDVLPPESRQIIARNCMLQHRIDNRLVFVAPPSSHDNDADAAAVVLLCTAEGDDAQYQCDIRCYVPVQSVSPSPQPMSPASSNEIEEE